VFEQSAPETASIAAVDFVDPRSGGGSLLDHDSGSGLGEPLNVSLFLFFRSGDPKPPSSQRTFLYMS
jgi:hypothetical protein